MRVMALTRRAPEVQWYACACRLFSLTHVASGVQVSKNQYDKVWDYIETGKQEGAKLVMGGVKRSGKGFWVDPTSTKFQLRINSLAPHGFPSLHGYTTQYEDRK